MNRSDLSTELATFLRKNAFQHCADLPWGKYLYADSQSSAFIKTSSDQKGMALIRAEASGLELIAPLINEVVMVPQGTLLFDQPDGVVLKMTRVDGTPVSKWARSVAQLTPSLAQAQSTMSLTELLAKESVDSELAGQLVRRFGNVGLTTTPSHGDFIYWNVLVGGTQPSLVDFEYVSDCRVIGFDDLHYQLAPWMIRILRWKLPATIVLSWGLRQARRVCRKHDLSLQPELLLALFFVHWAAIRRHWHPKFRPRTIGCVEQWATLI